MCERWCVRDSGGGMVYEGIVVCDGWCDGMVCGGMVVCEIWCVEGWCVRGWWCVMDGV